MRVSPNHPSDWSIFGLKPFETHGDLGIPISRTPICFLYLLIILDGYPFVDESWIRLLKESPPRGGRQDRGRAQFGHVFRWQTLQLRPFLVPI